MESLWHWAARFAQQGDVGKHEDSDIADGCFWEKDPSKLINSMVDSGWLDKHEHHRLVIHDWHDHCDEAVTRHNLQFLTRLDTVSNMSRQSSDVSCLPSPSPSPSPLPGPQPDAECPPIAGNGKMPEARQVYAPSNTQASVSPSTQRIADEKNLERIEAEIGRITSSVDSHIDLSPEDRAKRKKLREQAEILKKKLNFSV